MATDLLTLTEYLQRIGKAPGDLEDNEAEKLKALISDASQIIRDYCDRDFTLASDETAGPRQYRYYGSGLIEVDDCTSVTEVDTTTTPWSPYSRTLQAMEWIAGPVEDEVKTYVELWTVIPFPDSPEMGFQWNADRYAPRPRPILFTVTANWGWPAIPNPVKMATVWVIGELVSSDLPYVAESIEGYSHSMGSGRSASLIPQTVVSQRAQSLLDPYIRVNI